MSAVGNRYGEALFEAALEESCLDRVHGDARLLESVFAENPDLGKVLDAPTVSKAEKEQWARLLDAFFARKEDIAHVFSLVDIRHDPTADDKRMQEYLNYHILPFTVLATKADKLSRMKQKERVQALASRLGLGRDDIIPVSGETGQGKEEIFAKIRAVISRAREDGAEPSPQTAEGD